METQSEPNRPDRVAELAAAINVFASTLRRASEAYAGSPPEQARRALRVALHGVVTLIAELYPTEPALPRPLNDLLYHLDDLDRGIAADVLVPKKVENRPGTALTEELFRAIVAAAMTCLMNAGKKRKEAAQHIARRLAKLGAKSAGGKPIEAKQIEDWRDKNMTERACENIAAARYNLALDRVRGKDPIAAVDFLLDALTDISPASFPKKPPA